MSKLETTIDLAARDFTRAIVAAVKGASLQELFALQAPTVTPRHGRPAKAKPGRKPGRKPKAVAKKTRKKIKWPKCKHKGCTKNAWARGNGYCGEHTKKK